MEFHISRQARDRYQFDQALFGLHGNVVFANFHAARIFSQKINQKRDLTAYPEQAVRAGQVNALGMIDEILHHVIALYRRNKNPSGFSRALETLTATIGKSEVDRALREFCYEFPPLSVYRGELSVDEYLQGITDDIPNREATLEEMLMLWVANRNPATASFHDLFDDSRLAGETGYLRLIEGLRTFFEKQPLFGPDPAPLVELLRQPAMAVPYSLTGQLEFIREQWGDLLGRYLYRLLSSLDLVKEEDKSFFAGLGGPGPTFVPVFDGRSFAGAEVEVEAFSPDREWMPRLVLIAKNTYVWLDQLSRKFNRPIRRLDQIPDEELKEMARFGFTGLWLIGLWERSRASATIKQLCGNPEAIASAYSLYDYTIAADLGGEDGYQSLRDRAWQYGIRLASDMVPNHMGIDSRWVSEHPNWFLSLDYSPYPSYSFNGPDLSADPAVSINIEDHYFSRSDAAVVFKLYDHRNGQTQFVYHGNDGTTMPWNDTAQLNYLNQEVREAVIQTILSVARRFPIIRFDAAMTLAKRHYQRLWFPEPGTGGAIPSRAEHGLTKMDFDSVFPNEFWREVVDRVAQEAPDTLLLAEAFWLMEGYFVRTLGMHRVYNSAFMNMLRNEENAKYRALIKNTLEFDPEILKRYVNFMNNPDERTAVEQFGKGDKYFGICVLMATLPGLPMFGHGQFEGYAEKYGMEFKKAYWDETPDPYLVDRHRREITPLLQRRYLFAGVDQFYLYDFFNDSGRVEENVYAYTNSTGVEHALVICHNQFGSTSGWVRVSSATLDKQTRRLSQSTLAEALNIQDGENLFTIARDQVTGLEYLWPSRELVNNGIHFTLNAYEYHVFIDFRQVSDDEWQSLQHLYEYLGGRGVPSVSEALRELVLQPVVGPFRKIANAGFFRYLTENRLLEPGQSLNRSLVDEAIALYNHFLDGAAYLSGMNENRLEIEADLRAQLTSALSLNILENRYPLPGSMAYQKSIEALRSGFTPEHPERWIALLGLTFVLNIGKITGEKDFPAYSRSWIDEWQLGKAINETGRGLGLDASQAERSVTLVKILTEQQNWFQHDGKKPIGAILSSWLESAEVRNLIGVNRYKDVLWYNQEAFEEFVWWMVLLAVAETTTDPNAGAALMAERLLICHELSQKLLAASAKSEFKIDRLLQLLK